MVKAEYHMLDGRYINGTSLSIICEEGEFLAKTTNEPENKENESEGMFRVLKINRRIILEQIDCDYVHWKGDSRGRIKEPDKNCRLKCRHFEICPVRDYILLLKSGFE
ncbi:hypothetical protein A3K73_06000 [Candidatus Pacearchaeota archaeon RBG_13_36_9]|nr:MAG: hypothetical protein A3K73_06000 [Candidatus Pacearchaeota archaeon RBG_13_36_9]